MKSQAHFSFAGGKKVTFSDKISLPANQNGEKLHGHYVFASVNSKESVTVAVMPEKIVTNTVKQNTSTKAVSALIKSDENIHDLCDFELTGNRLELSYRKYCCQLLDGCIKMDVACCCFDRDWFIFDSKESGY